jgi:hypothetical protein
MAKWIGIGALAATLTLSFSTVISPVAAASAAVQKGTISGASHVSARGHYRHHQYVYHPYYPYRYGHPYYYSPGPFVPFPSPLPGNGWEW